MLSPHKVNIGCLRGLVDCYRRGVVDAGRSGINRARGYGDVRCINREGRASVDPAAPENLGEEPIENLQSAPSRPGLHRRRGNGLNNALDSPTALSVGEAGRPSSLNTINNNNGIIGSESSIAGLLGLYDDFRIVGSHRNSEDEIREVQLRGLSRRMIASPSLVLFPGKKQDMDVM